LNLNSLKVTSLNTSDADVAASGVKLYNTLTSATFATGTQLGTSQSFASSTATFSSLAYNLPVGTTYLWVAYDIAAGATANNTVDAKIAANDVNIGGTTYPATEQSPTGNRTVKTALSGTVTAGTGGTYPTLTNAGGLFEAINNYGLKGNLIVNVVGDMAEVGTNGLNNITETGAGGYTITIQPSAATNRTISGTYAGALIRFAGADRVTINGNYNGSGQYLMFSNTNTGSYSTIAFSGTANNNTIKNCKIYSKYRAITTTAADNTLIEGNDIYGDVAGNTNYSQAGIQLGGTSTNTKIRKNTIRDFYYNSNSGWSNHGIRFEAEATSVTEISNNVIYNIKADGYTSVIYYPAGIYIGTNGGNIQIYNNSINMSGATLTYTGSKSAGIAINTGATLLDIRNNVISNSQTGNSGNTYGIYSSSAATAFTNINYNDYYITGINPMIGYITSDRANITAWRTATGQDIASISADPTYTSATNLLPLAGSPLSYSGVSIAAVTTSINGVTRTNPSDIGAYQFSTNPAITTFSGTGTWSASARWDNGIPGPGSTAFINGSCTVTANAYCNNLTVNPAKDLMIVASQNLTINGQFTIKSTAAGTGSYINNGTVTYGLSPKVERYITADTWHLIASPVQSAVSGTWWSFYLKEYNEATNTFNSPFISVTTPLTVGKGYALWSASSSTGNTSRTYIGNLNESDYPISLAWSGNASHGWNLIGNMYTSAISGDIQNWTKVNVNNSIYVWNGSNYLTYNGTVGTLTGGIIPASQGFLVQASGAGASVTIQKSKRVHSTQLLYRNVIDNNLTLRVSGNNYSDGLVVNFNNEATTNYDNDYDVEKLNGLPEAPQIATLWAGKRLSINVLPELTDYTVMPLAFNCTASGTFTFTADGITSFNPTLDIRLQDVLTGEIVNLRNQPSYQFEYQYDSTSTTSRFNLLFGRNTTGISDNIGDLKIYALDRKIIIENPALVKLSQIAVYNNLGQLVKMLNSPEIVDNLKLDAIFAVGTYIVKTIDVNGKVVVKKVNIL
jgi:hypothetical protein